jgi:hypothetical protein
LFIPSLRKYRSSNKFDDEKVISKRDFCPMPAELFDVLKIVNCCSITQLKVLVDSIAGKNMQNSRKPKI